METNWKGLKEMTVNGNTLERREALGVIKDAIIGSNRQKGALISNDLVPEILNICTKADEHIEDKINALIILGSLAKGSPDQVEILVKEYNVIPILMREITSENNNRMCVEVSLSTMSSIYEHPYATPKVLFSDVCPLPYFLSLASAGSSLKTQVCVTSILVALCQTYDDQIQLLNAGTIHVLARMICLENEYIQVPALRCLSCMCFCNRSVTDNVCVTSYEGRSMPDILNSLMSRMFTPEIQLTAAKCLTYIYRSGTLLSTDCRILNKALPALARLCSDNYDHTIRVTAAETLAYLIEIDSELQQTAAITNHLLKSLSQLLQNNPPSTKQAALKCFASLAANDETIRKRVIEISGLMDAVLNGLNDCNSEVRLSSVRCLHSLSRSVQQLRTTFQDHIVWKPLMYIMCDPSIDFLVAVTSTICNLLLEFSPSKEPIINCGIVEKLCKLTEHTDPSLRLNSIWALMNMSYQSDNRVKTNIIDTLSMKRILELLYDPDPQIVMKTLGLLRNLLSKSYHIDFVLSEHSVQVIESVNMVLESHHSSDIKEQMLCIIGNIAAESQNVEYIINDGKIMARLGEFLLHPDPKLQAGALFVIHNIVHRKDICSEGQYSRLAELEIIKHIYELNKKAVPNKQLCDDYIYRILKQIVIQCKHFFPDIIN